MTEPGKAELPQVKETVKDVSQIQHTAGERFSNESQITQLVEAPLVSAVTSFFRKGILTISSSANVEEGRDNAHILVDWESLSSENKEIAKKILGVKEVTPDNWGCIFFSIPITPDTPFKEIAQWSEGVATQFVFQPATWELRRSVEQIKERDRRGGDGSFGKFSPEKIAKETGLYLGPDGFFYRNEGGYKRYHGISETPMSSRDK